MTFEPQEIADWRKSMDDYNRHRRAVNPVLYHNPDYRPPRTHAEIKIKEYAFDPILNRYRTAEQDRSYGATSQLKPSKPAGRDTPYDIITLNQAPPEPPVRAKAHSVDRYNQPFNIVTNAVNLPNHKAFRVRMKKINEEVFRDYNIINNQYWKNNGEKSLKDCEKVREQLSQKYQATHDFDPIRCNFYDQEKEHGYWDDQERKLKTWKELHNNRLPKSYKFREPINLNHEKNTAVSEGFEAFKVRERSRMQRFQKKYEMEARFHKMGEEMDERTDAKNLNRFYARRFVEEYREGVDPVTLQPAEGIEKRLQYALGNKRETSLEQPRPKRKFRFVY
jgi:hypothetical protein